MWLPGLCAFGGRVCEYTLVVSQGIYTINATGLKVYTETQMGQVDVNSQLFASLLWMLTWAWKRAGEGRDSFQLRWFVMEQNAAPSPPQACLARDLQMHVPKCSRVSWSGTAHDDSICMWGGLLLITWDEVLPGLLSHNNIFFWGGGVQNGWNPSNQLFCCQWRIGFPPHPQFSSKGNK